MMLLRLGAESGFEPDRLRPHLGPQTADLRPQAVRRGAELGADVGDLAFDLVEALIHPLRQIVDAVVCPALSCHCLHAPTVGRKVSRVVHESVTLCLDRRMSEKGGLASALL